MTSSTVTADDRLLRAPVGAAVLRLGLPLAFGMASHALVNLVDLALVGQLGPDAVAAAHVASTINFLPMILGNGISVATLGALSRLLGNGDRAAAAGFARRALWFALWCGALVGVATALPAAPCVDSVGVTGAVRSGAVHYLVVSNLGCLSMFALMQATALMRAAGETLMPIVLLIGANLLNLAFSVVLLFGWPALGIPSVGVAGAAYAAVAARTAAAVVGVLWLLRARHPLRLRGGRGGPPVAGVLLAGAWPQCLQIGLRAALVWVLTVFVQQKSGDAGVAAIGVTTRLDTMVLFAGVGFASAATTLAGRAVSAGMTDRARAAGLWAGAQALVFGSLLVSLFRWFAVPILHRFLPDAGAPIVDAGVHYLTIAAVAQPLAACALGAMGAVHGAGRMIPPLLVDLVGFCGLGLAMALAARLELDFVYAAMVGGTALVAALHLVLVRAGRWAVPD
ncbi:MAG TPA: MATE family efflux transporter [Burkholderiaceae bacterium]|nr:MATE family efflux transporter [Burkholderiaceae bacterium]